MKYCIHISLSVLAFAPVLALEREAFCQVRKLPGRMEREFQKRITGIEELDGQSPASIGRWRTSRELYRVHLIPVLSKERALDYAKKSSEYSGRPIDEVLLIGPVNGWHRDWVFCEDGDLFFGAGPFDDQRIASDDLENTMKSLLPHKCAIVGVARVNGIANYRILWPRDRTVVSLPEVAGGQSWTANGSKIWTDSSGKFKLRATFVELLEEEEPIQGMMKDADQSRFKVKLKKDDGALITVRLDQLSESNQKWVLWKPPTEAEIVKFGGLIW